LLPLALPLAEVLVASDGNGELLVDALKLLLLLPLLLTLAALALAVAATVGDGEAVADGCSDTLLVAEPDAV
jgi:hypothetical protein